MSRDENLQNPSIEIYRSRRARAILRPDSETTFKELHIGTQITPIKPKLKELWPKENDQ